MGFSVTLETPRLQLRQVIQDDSAFLLRLLNEPPWLRFIGDRGIRSQADADAYIRRRIWTQYESYGFGMYTLLLKPMNERIGICGLVKREFLTAPDLGFALLSEHVGGGYALEASRRVISYADTELGMERLYAISQLDNERSLRLLARLGFLHEGLCPGESQKSVGLFSRLRPTVKSDPR